MNVIVKNVFSIFVIALIICPVPPTTIIGVALMSNRWTNRYMADWSLVVVKIITVAFGRIKGRIFAATT